MLTTPRPWVAVVLAVVVAAGGVGPAAAVPAGTGSEPPADAVTTPAPTPSDGVVVPDEQPDPAAAPDATAVAPLDVVDPEGLAEPDVEAPGADDDAAAGTEETLGIAGEPAVPGADALVVGLTAPLDATRHDVTVVGASWAPTSATVHVDVRTMRDGVWSEWQELVTDSDTDGGEGRPGTDPYVVTDRTDVQVRLSTDDGSTPADARLDVFGGDASASDAAAAADVTAAAATVAAAPTTLGAPLTTALAQLDAVAGDEAGAGEESTGEVAPEDVDALPIVSGGTTTAAGTPVPTIQSRARWGAVPPSGPMDVGQVKGATIHHTAGTNDYTAAEVPAILRGIQNFHMQGRDWSDIGYNFLVDRYGGMWEGRYGGILNTTKGVHASSFNGITTGISVMGTFESATVTVAIKNALASLVAWKLALHGVSAAGSMSFLGVTYPTVVGHKDVPDAQTACPGRNLYAFLPTLRTMAAQRQVFPRVMADHDVDGDRAPDVVAATGRTYTGSYDPLRAAVRIGNGWSGMDLVVGSPALRGGTTVDLIYREAATGRLSVYHGNGKGGFSGKTVWGLGWKAVRSVIAPGDWTGDGRNDLLAVEAATGDLYLYRGDGVGGLAKRQLIGHGWKGVRSVMAAGDMNGDRRTDLVAIVAGSNELRLYPGNGAGGFGAVRSMGKVAASDDVAVGIGDVTGDGRGDVLLRDTATGVMTTVAGSGSGGVAARHDWGTGWDGKGALVSARGWAGTGRPTLITFDRANGLLYSYEASTSTRFTAEGSVALTPGATARVVVGDVTGSGGASIVTRDATGNLFLHEALGDGGFAAARQIGRGWNGMQQLAAAGDFDFDGTPDLLALTTDGTLYVYPFLADGSGALGSAFSIGSRFGAYRVVGVGGWSRGTSADIFAINTVTGDLRWYIGYGRGGLGGGNVIGTGWKRLAVVALGDVTGSGNNDLLVRDTVSGSTWIYPGNGAGGFAPRRTVGGLPTGGLL